MEILFIIDFIVIEALSTGDEIQIERLVVADYHPVRYLEWKSRKKRSLWILFRFSFANRIKKLDEHWSQGVRTFRSSHPYSEQRPFSEQQLFGVRQTLTDAVDDLIQFYKVL